jgi:serine protease inhibitor
MTRRTAATAALGPVLCAATLAACATPPAAGEGIERAEGVAARTVALDEASALPDVVAAARRIGTVTLGHAPQDGNTVVSPASIAVALAMLTEGARGETLAELEAVLGAEGDARRDTFAALRGMLAPYDGDPAVVQEDELPERPVLHLADQAVVHEGYAVSEEYLASLAAQFDAGVQRIDLTSPAAKQVLDHWVRHHTGGLVERSAIEPNTDLRLVLQDAVVLAARWEQPFGPGAAHDRPFTLAGGDVVDVETLAATVHVAYAEVDGWRAARLPYVEAFHTDVLLPPEGTDPASATPELLAAVDSALDAALDAAGPPATTAVDLTLPTLDVRSGPLDLKGPIVELGAPSVLDPATADLTGIGPQDLVVGQAFQQAVLLVDEEGTRAAAVTELGVEATSALVPQSDVELHLDRPFLLTIDHTETSWPLFVAAIRDPRH